MDAEENTLRILVSSDNHVGFLEKDGIRGSDSFRTLEEILFLSQKHSVDFILLGGDLFHENRPSMRCLNEVIRLIRTYCLSDRPIKFELLGDPQKTFSNVSFPIANYKDPNFNIGIPIFSIHGNHDDPAGPGNICASDLLHSCGFLNLFGKSNSIETMEVVPVLLRKGVTKLALYGIGAVREERLHRLFLHNKVTFLRPELESDGWFSMAAVHQNRVKHGPTGYLPEHFLPDFLDLVIWGHEHDCRIEPEWNSTQNFYVSQPGSSVATSLIDGEAIPKSIGLLEIRGKEFKMTRIPLRTVRPFLSEDIVLEDELGAVEANSLNVSQRIEEVCAKRILAAITQSSVSTASALSQEIKREGDEARAGLEKEIRPRFLPPAEPLVRLRVDTSGGFESFSSLRFGQKFVGRVANPKDLVTFNRKRDRAAEAAQSRTTGSEVGGDSDQTIDNRGPGLSVADVETLVSRLLSTSEKLQLSMFVDVELGKGLRRFVNQVDNDGIKSIVESVVTDTQGHLCLHKCAEERITSEVTRFADKRRRIVASNEDLSNPSTTIDNQFRPVVNSALTIPDAEISDDPLSTRLKEEKIFSKARIISHQPSAFSSDESRDASNAQFLMDTIQESDEDGDIALTNSRFSKSRTKRIDASDVNSNDTQLSLESFATVSSSRGRGSRRARGSAPPRVRRAATRRRGAESRSIMPDSEEEIPNDGSISFDFRRKRRNIN